MKGWAVDHIEKYATIIIRNQSTNKSFRLRMLSNAFYCVIKTNWLLPKFRISSSIFTLFFRPDRSIRQTDHKIRLIKYNRCCLQDKFLCDNEFPVAIHFSIDQFHHITLLESDEVNQNRKLKSKLNENQNLSSTQIYLSH